MKNSILVIFSSLCIFGCASSPMQKITGRANDQRAPSGTCDPGHFMTGTETLDFLNRYEANAMNRKKFTETPTEILLEMAIQDRIGQQCYPSDSYCLPVESVLKETKEKLEQLIILRTDAKARAQDLTDTLAAHRANAQRLGDARGNCFVTAKDIVSNTVKCDGSLRLVFQTYNDDIHLEKAYRIELK
jgi:hypothetical protein